MSSRDYVIARYEKGGHKFEILVNPDKALKYREGSIKDLSEVVVGDYIYKDVRKGDKASPEEIVKTFGTADFKAVAEVILKNGELQLTTDQRRKLLDQKRKLIINYIAKSVVDPKTKAPIPPQRIEKAMEEAKITVDLYKSVEEQAAKIVKELTKVLPLKVAKALVTIKIPPEVAGRAYQEVRRLGELKNERWLNDGSLHVELEIPAGMQAEVIDAVNRATKGTAEVNIKVI
ncbi:MAG: rRNA metabolism protein [Zestosphaera tikiterensis]|uniref:rRNA metabolism protein n=1 Tax=Zestosphaera tikiterensis TaxID=1973259 RepID=A0A2R7Y503_9CREN|nr:MAG: rRNA metabolism protein [Zestosphaera tikiterensis]